MPPAPVFHCPQLPNVPKVGTSMPLKINKRIIVCCDGTWQDGVVVKEHWKCTNVLKLSRAIKQYDERTNYAIPQIVFYQRGIGSSQNLYSEYVEGATGGSLGERVHEAYAFVAQNFCPGDEIFLFGYSRGAYTARMIALFIGAIGILDKTEMDHFADIFRAFHTLGKSKDHAEIGRLHAQLAPWTSSTSRGKLRAISDNHNFSIKCVGVFDTVGAIGLPEEITFESPCHQSMYGFSNTILGEHIERAYQALAMHETRADFNCDKFEQTQDGRRKGQVLKQCWFTGEHADIGGGLYEHDLSDLTLIWMVAHIEDTLALDLDYVRSLVNPVAPWGKLPHHDARAGIFALCEGNTRPLPTQVDHITHECMHPSVLEQDHVSPRVHGSIRSCPSLVCGLLPFEEEMKQNWPYAHGTSVPAVRKNSKVESATVAETTILRNVTKEILSVGAEAGTEIIKEIRTHVAASKCANGTTEKQSSATALLINIAHEGRAGAGVALKEIAKYRH